MVIEVQGVLSLGRLGKLSCVMVGIGMSVCVLLVVVVVVVVLAVVLVWMILTLWVVVGMLVVVVATVMVEEVLVEVVSGSSSGGFLVVKEKFKMEIQVFNDKFASEGKKFKLSKRKFCIYQKPIVPLILIQ